VWIALILVEVCGLDLPQLALSPDAVRAEGNTKRVIPRGFKQSQDPGRAALVVAATLDTAEQNVTG
jgi:hypothetical protein